MSDRKRLLLLIGTMTGVALVVTCIAILILYRAAYAEQKARLVETCHSQARLLESIAQYARDRDPTEWRTITLNQIVDAHARYEGFGRTGEFTLARRDSSQIVFLLSHRHYDLDNPKPAPFDPAEGRVAVPMRRALLGQSGTVVGLDYRGVNVLAAYEPVAMLDWGIVAKIDMAEIRAPFIRAGSIAGVIALLLASLGAVLSLRLGTPVIRHLEESAVRDQAIVETASEGIITTDAAGTIKSFNRAAEEIFGYNRAAVIGRPAALLVPATVPSAEDKGVLPWTDGEAVGQRKDGSTLSLHVAISDTVVHGQRIYTSLVRDITDEKRAEDALERTRDDLEERVIERTEELDSFTYTMSHDLRAPLRAIDGFSQMLLDEHAEDLNDEGQRLLNVVYESAKRMGQLIDDLLALSRLGRREMRHQPIDMEELAREAFDAVQQQRPAQQVRLRLHTLPPAEGDRVMVRRVFEHLITNAFKFTQHRRNAVVELGTYEKNDSTAYFVRDNGAGFDMDYADKLFGVFERLHDPSEFEGTGVGLAIVERVVRRHGGRVWAEGAVDEGATFYFTLPS